jgi:hypothetical protein
MSYSKIPYLDLSCVVVTYDTTTITFTFDENYKSWQAYIPDSAKDNWNWGLVLETLNTTGRKLAMSIEDDFGKHIYTKPSISFLENLSIRISEDPTHSTDIIEPYLKSQSDKWHFGQLWNLFAQKKTFHDAFSASTNDAYDIYEILEKHKDLLRDPA